MGLPDIDNIPETGAVFTLGRSRFADNVASHFFIRKDPVLSVACGDEHSAVVCQSGRLFVFGSNDWGQLGLGHKNHVSKPSCVKILKPEKVTHVACGRAHTLICTGGQKIFACGSDQEGQLGRGNSAMGDSATSPILVYDCGLTGRRIVQIAAGSHHSMALTSDGTVVAWGSNLEGQLGLSGISGLVNKPTKVQISEAVKQISAGYYHSAFLTESGVVYVCGESESGKLGIDVNFSTQVAPKQMHLPSRALHVACGGHHTFLLAENGNLYGTGSNVSGQLAMGTAVTEVPTPKALSRDNLQNEKVVKIACGEGHSALITESGKLFTCGDGRHGKLGLEENENNVHELTFAVKYQELVISDIACGGCHTILIGKKRETSEPTNLQTLSLQMDHQIQKKKPLPPLKLPINRLQNETHVEKITESELKKEPLRDENTSPNIAMDVIENVVEKENNIIVESPGANVKSSITNCTENVEEAEATGTATNIPQTSEVVERTKSAKDNEEMRKEVKSSNNERTLEEGIESKLYVKEETKITTMDSSSLDDEQKNILKNEVHSKVDDDRKIGSSEIETAVDPIPPPKPPRQKIVNAENSTNDNTPTPKVSSSSGHEQIDNQSYDLQDNMKKEDVSGTSLVKNEEEKREDSSAARTHEQRQKSSDNPNAVVEESKEKEKILENDKQDNDNAADDADVVQSSTPKTGKMAKLFKAKRQQEIENGTKDGGTLNPKAKSRTCSIL